MTASFTLASSRSGGSLPTPLVVLLVIAGIGYVLWRRLTGEPVQTKRLVVLPAVFTVLGVVDLTKSNAPPLSSADVAFLVAGVATSLALGAARGASVELLPRVGYLYQRYRKATVAWWVVLVVTKLGLDLAAHAAGAAAAAGTHSLMLALGVSLLGEAAVVAPRALATGIPFAPDPKRADTNRPSGRRTDAWNGSDEQDATSTAECDDDRVPTRPAAHGEPDQSAPWRSPGWREGLDWVRSQLDEPPAPPRRSRRRRRR
jgi:hypothetical protein